MKIRKKTESPRRRREASETGLEEFIGCTRSRVQSLLILPHEITCRFAWGFVEFVLCCQVADVLGGGSRIFLAERGPLLFHNLSNGCCRCGARSFLGYRFDDMQNIDAMVRFYWSVGWMVLDLFGPL